MFNASRRGWPTTRPLAVEGLWPTSEEGVLGRRVCGDGGATRLWRNNAPKCVREQVPQVPPVAGPLGVGEGEGREGVGPPAAVGQGPVRLGPRRPCGHIGGDPTGVALGGGSVQPLRGLTKGTSLGV